MLSSNPKPNPWQCSGKGLSFCAVLLTMLVGCVSAHQAPPPLVSNDEPKQPLQEKKNDLALPSGKSAALNSRDEKNDSLELSKQAERAEVQKWIGYFTKEGHDRLQRYLRRGAQYKKQIHAILKKLELPTNLYYVALIESGFQTDARSEKSAVGFWQFMLPTAKNYGLRITDFVDERRDPLRSTVAAALYLKDLKNVFDSWPLALAAYNAGQSRIMNVIIKSGTRDFWQLCEIGFIPRQTKDYIPKFLAAILIGENPERFGFDMEGVEEIPNMVAATVPSPVHLAAIAERAGLTLEEIKLYNPHLLKGVTPPSSSSYRMWFPEGKVNFETLASLPVIPKSQFRRHRHAVAEASPRSSRHSKRSSNESNAARAEMIRYQVRKGDSLTGVAQRFKMSIHRLKRLNSLRNSRLSVGQILKVESSKEG